MLKDKKDRVKAPPIDTGGPTETDIQKELADLYQMAKNWYDSDIRGADCDGVEDFILSDYMEKINQWMMPYVARFLEIEAITQEEYGEFTGKLWKLCEDMRTALHLPEPRKNIIPLDQRRISVP